MAYGAHELNVTVVLVTESCCKCHIPFGIERDFQRWLREHPGESFFCPKGHAQHYIGPTETDRLRGELLEIERRLQEEQHRRLLEKATYTSELRGERIKRGKVEAKLKRTETRIAAGVCPHCHRTFQQLAAHMRAQHHDQAPHVPERTLPA